MTEHWIAVRTALFRSAKIRALMRLLKCNKHTAFGVAVCWLGWVCEQTEDGKTGLTPEELDEEIGFRGSANAMISIGWAALGEDGCVEALDFDQYCSTSAKKRIQTAGRVARYRENKKCNAPSVTNVTQEELQGCNAPSVTDVTLDAWTQNKTYNIDNIDTYRVNTTVSLAHAHPKDAQEVEAYMKNLPICGLDIAEVQVCASSFFDELEAVGWVSSKNVPIRDWRAIARSYLNKWQRNRATSGLKDGRKITRRSEQKKNYSLDYDNHHGKTE